jgi:hypothetical protein
MLTSTLVLASFASAALAVNTARALQFPDTVSLAERQAEGGRYECHADCGKIPILSVPKWPSFLPAPFLLHAHDHDHSQASRSRAPLRRATVMTQSGLTSSMAASNVLSSMTSGGTMAAVLPLLPRPVV